MVATMQGLWLPAKSGTRTGFVMAKYIYGSDEYLKKSSLTVIDTPDVSHYYAISPQYHNWLNVREKPSMQSKRLGLLHRGTLVCPISYHLTNNSEIWLKIHWGGANNQFGYILSDHTKESLECVDSCKANRAIKIATSMVSCEYPYNGNKANLGLTASQWCVQFVYWLLQASGCTDHPSFSDATVYSLISYYHNLGRVSEGRHPNRGDIVLYSLKDARPSNKKAIYAHAGFVIDVDRNQNIIKTVEGNLGNAVKMPMPNGFNYLNPPARIGNNPFIVLGFATPNWEQ